MTAPLPRVRIPEYPCGMCGKIIPSRITGTPGRTRRYCSNACEMRAWRADHKGTDRQPRQPVDTEPSPEAWDGTTKYCEPAEPTFLWVRTCFICSREQTTEPERMTRSRANLIATAGIPNCVSCHGWVLLEELSLAGRTVVT